MSALQSKVPTGNPQGFDFVFIQGLLYKLAS